MCGCNKKINGMSKKRMNGFGSAASGMLPILAGFVVGKIATKQLTALSTNPDTGNLVKVAAGLFFASKSGFLGGVAQGLALQGASELVTKVIPDSIGLLPPGMPARYLAGIDSDPGAIQPGATLAF